MILRVLCGSIVLHLPPLLPGIGQQADDANAQEHERRRLGSGGANANIVKGDAGAIGCSRKSEVVVACRAGKSGGLQPTHY